MTNYELAVILPGTFNDEQTKDFTQKLSEEIKSAGAEFKKTSEPSNKRLAYAIKKVRNGIYINIYFSANPEIIKQLDKNLKLITELIRFQITKVKPIKDIKRKERKIKTENIIINEKEKHNNTNEENKKVSMDDLNKKLDEILGE
jgi:small subunit ribosomal protein S6